MFFFCPQDVAIDLACDHHNNISKENRVDIFPLLPLPPALSFGDPSKLTSGVTLRQRADLITLDPSSQDALSISLPPECAPSAVSTEKATTVNNQVIHSLYELTMMTRYETEDGTTIQRTSSCELLVSTKQGCQVAVTVLWSVNSFFHSALFQFKVYLEKYCSSNVKRVINHHPLAHHNKLIPLKKHLPHPNQRLAQTKCPRNFHHQWLSRLIFL